jgi:uncharacterized protein YodC (DUF2158 family)
MAKFSVGDQVKHKSPGGPVMVIKTVPATATDTSYVCEWMDGSSLKTQAVDEAMLVPFTPVKPRVKSDPRRGW